MLKTPLCETQSHSARTKVTASGTYGIMQMLMVPDAMTSLKVRALNHGTSCLFHVQQDEYCCLAEAHT